MLADTLPSPVAGHLTVPEAAAQLSVTEDMVRKLIARGELAAARVGRDWIIPTEAVEHRLESRPAPGRRLTPARAWGLLFLAIGEPVTWLDRHARWRLSRYLATHRLANVRARLVERGRRRSFRAHPGMLERLRADESLMLTGISAAKHLRLGLVGASDRVEAYVDEAQFDSLVRRYHLRQSSDPNVILRVVPRVGWSWPPARVAPVSAVALDLLDDPEPRAKRLGEQLLREIGR
jgi:excisionase family DNA binding protein